MREKHIVIVGGGITGMSTAFALQQMCKAQNTRIRCTVLERQKRLGGKILTHREQGFVMEGGPDSMLARKPAGVALIEQLGIASEVVGTSPRAHKTYVLHDGRLERLLAGSNMGVPGDWSPLLTTPLLSLSGKIRALMDLFIARQHATGDLSLGHFLRRRLGDELVDAVVEPLLGGIYAGRVDDLSLDATYPQFRNLEAKHRSLILGSRQARRKTPVPTDGRSVFITVQGGLQTLVERLYECLVDFAEVLVNRDVAAIRRAADHAYLVDVRNEDLVETIAADAVIVTTPSFAAAPLLAPLVPSARVLADIPFVSTATVIVGFTTDQIEVDLDASGFVVPSREGRAITACTWVSSKWPQTTPQNFVMLRCYVGRAGDSQYLSLADSDLVKLVQRELREILGITAAPVFSRVTRWNDAMPQYTPGHLERVAQVEAALTREAPGVFIAGASYRGLGIPDCIAQGNQAAKAAYQYVTATEPPIV